MTLKTWLIAGTALLGTGLAGGEAFAGAFNSVEFIHKVGQLQAAYGRPPVREKPRLSPRERKVLLEKAGQIVQNFAFFYGTEAIAIGARDIDWFGGQKRHQEWVAQLNRFSMLEPLSKAYLQTGDVVYAARASELMIDWCDFWDRHDNRFIDPQNNNVLNVSVRIRAWLGALAVFLDTPPFSSEVVERLLTVLAHQSEMLAERTHPGDSNWQIAQAHALLEAGIALDFMPASVRWRTVGSAVLNACFARQFRADGSHVENTTGYHNWMVEVMITSWQLSQLRPDLGLQADPEMIAKGLQFRQLGAPFAFNDSSYAGSFPKWPRINLGQTAARGGIRDWQPLTAGVFPDAGLVFGGNADEKFFFDAGKFGGWHSHLSRLSVEFGAYGHNLLIDPAITTYERNDYHFVYGRTTRSHATVHFNGAHQLRADAELIDTVLDARFGVAVGAFEHGAYQGKFSQEKVADIDAEMQRAVLWLAEEFVLLFDHTQIHTAPPGPQMTGYVFPSAPAETWELLSDRLAWRTFNQRTPNLLVQMLLKPVEEVSVSCVAGQQEPELRGWIGTARTAMTPAPTLEFTAETGSAPAIAVTLLAAAPAGQEVMPFQVEAARSGYLDFRTADGTLYELRYCPDFRQRGALQATTVTAEATLLLRCGSRCFVYRATSLTVGGVPQALPTAIHTGWME